MLNFVPHKINETYKKVEFYRVNKELCNNKVYNKLSPTAILLYSLLCDRLSLAYSNANDEKISKINKYFDEDGNMYVRALDENEKEILILVDESLLK